MLKSRQEGVGEAAPEPGRDFPSWILPDTLDAADVVLTGPDGAELLCKESRLSSGKRLLSSVAPAVPGTYVWSGRHAAGMPLHTQVVNFPVGESNLQTLAAGNLACIRGCRHGFRKTGGSNGQNTSVAVAAGGGRSSFRLGTLAFLPACPDGP